MPQKLTTAQPVSSKRNLPALDNPENVRAVFMLKKETWECCYCMHSFLCLGFLPEI